MQVKNFITHDRILKIKNVLTLLSGSISVVSFFCNTRKEYLKIVYIYMKSSKQISIILKISSSCNIRGVPQPKDDKRTFRPFTTSCNLKATYYVHIVRD